MPEFIYIGKTMAGKKEQGMISAANIEAAKQKLKQQKVTVNKIRPKAFGCGPDYRHGC